MINWPYNFSDYNKYNPIIRNITIQKKYERYQEIVDYLRSFNNFLLKGIKPVQANPIVIELLFQPFNHLLFNDQVDYINKFIKEISD